MEREEKNKILWKMFFDVLILISLGIGIGTLVNFLLNNNN